MPTGESRSGRGLAAFPLDSGIKMESRLRVIRQGAARRYTLPWEATVAWRRFMPWRWLLRKLAESHGFLDPVALLARLEGFAQPSEVREPIELLRAGVVFHARGLVNTKAIQHNLDWVWPYWVERQFDPEDESFVPRAFSITHVNLTHRNWTAVGLPDCPLYPILDPRGLATPLYDGWSLDAWVQDDAGILLPSRAAAAEQRLETDPGMAVVTRTHDATRRLATRGWVEASGTEARFRLRVTAGSEAAGWLVVALRPANPEGVSFVHSVRLADDRRAWSVDDAVEVRFSEPVERHEASDYRSGDVYLHLADPRERTSVECPVGLATAAAMFRLAPGSERSLEASVVLPRDEAPEPGFTLGSWASPRLGRCRLEVPDPRFVELFTAAERTLVLLSPGEAYPGPYTYRRFWFRDSAFLLHALAVLGHDDRVARGLKRFPERQGRDGYFLSQEGEWDSNGEALWILRRHVELSGARLDAPLLDSVRQAGDWIVGKRLPDDLPEPHAGLLPAGFSAEHLGPNDHYFWDDFWGVAGLDAAAWLLAVHGDRTGAARFAEEARRFRSAVDRALAKVAARGGRPGVPAAPGRRMDAGAIGSLAAWYPLGLYPPDDPRLIATLGYLLDHCMVKGLFFQDMIHSGLNAYLTLHMAEALLRAGDLRALPLVDAVAALASPTGQWPEAAHPRTLGGCMGDGHHAWASAEWVLMMRALFVIEEPDGLRLGAGLREEWTRPGTRLAFGPTATPYGALSVEVEAGLGSTRVRWSGLREAAGERARVVLPGHHPLEVELAVGEVEAIREPGG